MKWKLIIASAFSLTLIAGSLLHSKPSAAQAFLPVGGPIIKVLNCCNGLMLMIGPPKPGLYFYAWGTPLYPFYNITMPGPYVLGRAIPGGACLDPYTIFPPPCTVAIPTLGTFVFLGTSAL